MGMKVVLSLALVIATVGLSSGVSAAKPDKEPKTEETKITICHRTNSVKNPYIRQTVSDSAVDGLAGNSGNEADHYGEHKGPLASSETVAQGYKDAKTEWGDIIPPVTGVHSGLNWTAAGQAIYNNQCNYVAPVATDTTITPGGNTLGVTTGVVSSEAATTDVPSPQITVPTGGVNAGASDSIISSLVALIVSIGSIFYGARRLNKISR